MDPNEVRNRITREGPIHTDSNTHGTSSHDDHGGDLDPREVRNRLAQRGSQSVDLSTSSQDDHGGDRDPNEVRQRQLQRVTPQSPAGPITVGGSSVSTPQPVSSASPMQTPAMYMITTVPPRGSPPYLPSPGYAAAPAPPQNVGQYNQPFQGSPQPATNTSYWSSGQSMPSPSQSPFGQHPSGSAAVPTPTGHYANTSSPSPISPQQVSFSHYKPSIWLNMLI